jgi:hypothetical protein
VTQQLEICSVIDAWSWLEEVNEWDYRPILESQFELLVNKNERSKLSIASVLNNLVASKSGKEDPFGIRNEMESGCEKLSTKHKAGLWFDAFEKCRDFLGKETEIACRRLNEWMESNAHQIIDTACSDELDTAGFQFPYTTPLSLGIIHYSSILRDISGCTFGEAMMVGLVGHPSSRIPYRFVLNPGEPEKKELAKVKLDIGDLSVNILALCSAAIILLAEANTEAEVFVKHLEQVGLKAEVTASIGPKTAAYGIYKQVRVHDSLIKFNDKRIDKGGTTFLPKNFHDTYYSKIKLFNTWEGRLTGLYDLLAGAKVYGKSPDFESQIAALSKIKEKVQYPTKVLAYVVSQSKLGFAWYAQKYYKFDLAKFVAAKGDNYYISRETLELIQSGSIERFERMTVLYKGIDYTGKILAGPVAFVFGAWNLAFQGREMIDSWQNGDYGTAIGTALLYTASVITVSCAIVETLALAKVAWAAAYMSEMGPLGLLAALIVIAATLVIWALSKNELELFTLHCFLGDDYGTGSSNKTYTWAEGTTFRSWASGEDRYTRQLVYLVNLISSFKVLIRFGGTILPSSIYGGFVQPGYLPPGAKCEVVVIGHYLDSANNHKDLSSTALIDMSTGEYIMTGDPLLGYEVTAIPDGTWGTDAFRYFKIRMRHELTNGVHEEPVIRYGKTYEHTVWTLKVRFDILGHGLGANNRYLEFNSIDIFGWDAMKNSIDS